MAPLSALQSSFAAGEISPLMWGRVELPRYNMGARTMRNMVLFPQGPCANRPGTQFMCEVKDSTKATRLVAFRYSTAVNYMLEFGDQYIRFHTTAGKVVLTTSDVSAWVTGTTYAAYAYVKNGGLVYRCILGHTAGATTEPGVGASWATAWVQDASFEIASPYLEADLFLLDVAQSADVMWITHASYQTRTLARSSAISWSLSTYTVKGGPFMPVNETATTIALTGATVTPGSAVTLTASAAIFDALHVGGLFGIRHMYGQNNYTVQCPETGGWTSASYPVFGPWMITVTPDKTKQLDEGDIFLERSVDDGATWTKIYTWVKQAGYTPIITTGAEWDEPALLRFRRTDLPSTGDLATFILESQGALKWTTIRITGYTGPTVVTGTLMEAYDRAGDSMPYWAEGVFSAYRGWPTSVHFYEDRLVLGGCALYPDTFYGSQPGDYNNFMVHIPVLDSDAIEFTLLSREVNAIHSMMALGDALVMFTSGGEWAVSGGQYPLAPSNVLAHEHGFAGSSAIAPVKIGSRVIHAQRLGGAIRELYSDGGGYIGSNISALANHLTDGQIVKQMAYQQTPWSINWVVLESGALLGITYMPELEMVGWHRHDTGTADRYESVACMPGSTEDETWFVVRRYINGAWKRYIERLHTRVFAALADAFFVDCGITYSGAATTNITGLSHLEGCAVAVLADGVVKTGHTVSGGKITLAANASKVQVGLPYYADFESLGPSYNVNGSTMGQIKRVGAVRLRLYQTAGGQKGKDSSTLTNLEYPAPEVSGGLFTGDTEPQPIRSDWTRYGRVFVRQADPLPITIIAVIPEVEHGG